MTRFAADSKMKVHNRAEAKSRNSVGVTCIECRNMLVQSILCVFLSPLIIRDCIISSVSDREGHGHKAVLYKSHFPPLRHAFYQRHHCIHRLINHVYYKGQEPLLFIASRHGGSSDKTLRSQEY